MKKNRTSKRKGNPIRVLTYGTFDLLHRGHINLLRRARALGDFLIVAVSSDEFNRIKGKACAQAYAERSLIVSCLRPVDKVIKETCWEQKIADIKKHKVDVFVMGNDWKGKFDELKKHCRVVYLPRTKGVSTTLIKNKLSGRK